MKHLFWIIPAIAAIAALFGSTYPDGLNYILLKLGSAHSSTGGFSPMANYSIKIIPNNLISSTVAGSIGAMIVMAGFRVAVLFSKKDLDSMSEDRNARKHV